MNATNRSGTHEVSDNREAVNVVETGIRAPLGFGRGTAEIRLMDDQPNTPGTSDFTAQFEVTWSQRF